MREEPVTATSRKAGTVTPDPMVALTFRTVMPEALLRSTAGAVTSLFRVKPWMTMSC